MVECENFHLRETSTPTQPRRADLYTLICEEPSVVL